MPSTTSRVVSIVLDSSTVMTPSLPTFFMASAMMLPTCLSVLALMVPTCAIMSPFTSRESLLRSEEHTSELQSHSDLVCRLLLEKKKAQTRELLQRASGRCGGRG